MPVNLVLRLIGLSALGLAVAAGFVWWLYPGFAGLSGDAQRIELFRILPGILAFCAAMIAAVSAAEVARQQSRAARELEVLKTRLELVNDEAAKGLIEEARSAASLHLNLLHQLDFGGFDRAKVQESFFNLGTIGGRLSRLSRAYVPWFAFRQCALNIATEVLDSMDREQLRNVWARHGHQLAVHHAKLSEALDADKLAIADAASQAAR